MRRIPVVVACAGDVLGPHSSATILCLLTDRVVRKLERRGDLLFIDALTETIEIPLSTPIVFEPWIFDRGSLVFDSNKKLATEGDWVQWPDGTCGFLHPSRRDSHAHSNS